MYNNTELVNIDSIIIGSRKISLKPATVEEIARSIQVVGLLQPVVITVDRCLIAGLHRIEACKSLGWTEIPAVVKDYGTIEAELSQIDENLIRNNLTALEEGELLSERYAIYQALHPETKRGVAGARARHGLKNDVLSFAEDAALKIGKSPRTIQRDIAIVNMLSDETKKLISETPIADNYDEIKRFSCYNGNPELQEEIIDKIKAEKVKKVSEAMRLINRAQALPLTSAADKLKRVKKEGNKASEQLGKLEDAINELEPQMKYDSRQFVEALKSRCEAILSIIDKDLFAAGYADLEEAA